VNLPPSTQGLIDALVRATGESDPFAAIRLKARGAIEQYRSAFGEPEMPLNVDALASLLGIGRSAEGPAHSGDAELVPAGDGRVAIRVNPDRPETRMRFSVAHEVSHTFFPNYQTKTWCRTDARHRRRENADDLLEMLCDAGAAELLLPLPWFAEDARAVTTGAALVDLARRYVASREATLRRFAETHAGSVAGVFLSWKLKPTEKRTVGRADQGNLLGLAPAEEARRALQLRLDYSIPSAAFAAAGYFLPKDKSVKNDGPLYAAASTGRPCEGECRLDLGQAAGRYRVLAVPLWTDEGSLGPRGENAVAAIVEPLEVKRPKGKRVPEGPSLFD
jgi:hypothetical protein